MKLEGPAFGALAVDQARQVQNMPKRQLSDMWCRRLELGKPLSYCAHTDCDQSSNCWREELPVVMGMRVVAMEMEAAAMEEAVMGMEVVAMEKEAAMEREAAAMVEIGVAVMGTVAAATEEAVMGMEVVAMVNSVSCQRDRREARGASVVRQVVTKIRSIEGRNLRNPFLAHTYSIMISLFLRIHYSAQRHAGCCTQNSETCGVAGGKGANMCGRCCNRVAMRVRRGCKLAITEDWPAAHICTDTTLIAA